MLSRKTIFVLLVGFLIGILLIFSFRVVWVKYFFYLPFVARKTSITLMPPSRAYSGIITNISGEVKKQGRDTDDFTKVASGAAVVQGESLQTKNGTTTLTFTNIAKVSVGPNSEISFVDGIPAEFLFNQPSGKATYEMLDDTKSLSVRSLHMLLQVSGKATVTLQPGSGQALGSDNKSIIVEMQYGNGKIGINDTDNNTHVYQLAQGQKATIDDEKRIVEVE